MQGSASFLTLLDRIMQIRLFYKFQSIMEFTDIQKDSVIVPKAIAQRRIAEKKGNNVVEFFNLWRARSVFAMDRQRYHVGSTGIPVQNSDGGGIYFHKMAPADLTYRFWIWSQSLNKLNKCAERFMFWLYSNPKLDMMLDEKYPLAQDMVFGDYASEHQLEEQYEKGIIYVYSFDILLKAWIMDFSNDGSVAETKAVKKIHLNISDSSNEPNYVEVCSKWVIDTIPIITDTGTGEDNIFLVK